MSTRGYGDRWWDGGSAIPADLEKTDASAAASAASTSKDSYTKKIKLALVKNKKYKFYFTYDIEDPETKKISESDRSPVVTYTFDIPNLTKQVQNLTLTAGSQSYGVKFNLDPESVQEDVVIFESLTSNFATQTIVYTGTSTSVSILTTGANAFAPRWIKVRSRDRWDDLNISEVTAGPVTPFSADVDTTYTVANPGSSSASASIDPKDLSGFSLVSTISWAQSTDTKTAGYAIRWSTDNPSTVTTPLWEYASVSGIATTSFTATGLIPNTTYYYQVASTTPYDVVNWTGAASGTFIASDADGTAAGALARLKSYIAIGGATQDLFKIGTGITQSINLNTDPLVSPTLTAGTYHGIILNKSTTNVGNNFWLTTGQFRVGNPTEFMYWNGTNLYLTGNINATGGKFTGNVQLAIPAGATTSGTLYAGANPTSGARVRLSSEGIFAYNSTSTNNTTGLTFSLQQSNGQIDAREGTVGGWTLATTGLSSTNTKIENTGNITLGNQVGSIYPIIRLSADDPTYRLWIGSNAGASAPFRVTKEGVLYATGAVITLGTGSTIDGYATTTALGNYTLSSVTTGINSRLQTVEGAYVSATTLSTGLSTKNTTFVSDSAPTANRIGDIWIDTSSAAGNEIKTWNGSSWTSRRDTTFAKTTDLSTKLNATSYVVQSSVDNSISMNTNGITVFSGATSNNGFNSGITFNSAGIAAWKNGNPTFSILTDGTATFYGTLSAATGSFSGSVTASSGSIGGFDLGSTYGDLTAKTITSVRPRIIFGSKILLGWISSSTYGLQVGNDYDTTNARFIVNTADDVFRASIDTTRKSYAMEVAIALRAYQLRYSTSTGYGLIAESSSRRFKENITYLPKTFYERILNVSPATWTYKHNVEGLSPEMGGMHSIGLIAEDLEEAGLSYFVERDMQGRPTNLQNMIDLPQFLIPIIRDLKAEVSDLKSRLEAVENV
jgi:hypothetical protein